MTSTLEVQRALAALGYRPGPLDGIRGRLTIRAVKAFQADHGLAVDGIVGPRTREKLFGGLPPGPTALPAGSAAPLRSTTRRVERDAVDALSSNEA